MPLQVDPKSGEPLAVGDPPSAAVLGEAGAAPPRFPRSLITTWPRQVVDFEEAWLLGQPPLTHYLDTVERSGSGAGVSRASLVAGWSAANDVYIELERTEAGLANAGRHRPLDPRFEGLATVVRDHPFYRKNFDCLPTGFEMVELDKLMVYQPFVGRTYVESSMRRLGLKPDPATVFRFCFPLDEPRPVVEVERLGRDRFQFRSTAGAFRAHSLASLGPESLATIQSFGPVGACLGLPLGLNANFLNAVRVGRRYLLHNGYHRACALRALGVSHAPCLVQTAKRVDEVMLGVDYALPQAPEYYFETARPPLLRDFFDPRIVRLVPLREEVRVVDVTVEIREYISVR